MQVAGLSQLSPKYNGAVEATLYIIRTEGWWGGMYKGLWPNLLKVRVVLNLEFWQSDVSSWQQCRSLPPLRRAFSFTKASKTISSSDTSRIGSTRLLWQSARYQTADGTAL